MSDRPFTLLLIDDDPVFRLGLRIWLQQFADLQVVAEAASGTEALQQLGNSDQTQPEDAASASQIDLAVLNLELGRSDPTQIQGLDLCRQLKADYPALRVLLLSALSEPVLLAAAQQAGADGYCPKTLNSAALATTIRQVAAGTAAWVQPAPQPVSAPGQPLSMPGSEAAGAAAVPPGASSRRSGIMAAFRQNLRRSGLRQIDATLAEIVDQLQDLDLSALDRAILAGRRRELRVARWLVHQLLSPAPSSTPPEATTASGQASGQGGALQIRPLNPLVARGSASLTPEVSLRTSPIKDILFNAVLANLQTSLQNQTDQPLEIDILREDQRRELLYLVLRKLEEAVAELRYSQVLPEQLSDKRASILQDLWQATVTDFFGKYYTVTLGERLDYEVVSCLLQDQAIVQTAILDKIPFVADLLAHLLFESPLLIDNTLCAAGTPAAIERAELLLQHLIIQVANGVIQPLLNQFANVESIKQTFYDRRLMSTREIERFRNSLSWRYRVEQYIVEPKAIFESQYRLFTCQGRGIKTVSIYAPRSQELERLSGLQMAVTVALEARDAIAPRLRSAVSFVGSGLIYVLTEVIGRGIGLVGRGILKGVGTAWQDGKFSRNSERQK